MIITAVLLACIGWVLGVHLPWYCILILWVGGLYLVRQNKEGLGGIAEFLIIATIILPMFVAGFIYGDVTFVDIGETIKYLFTGG